MTTQPRILGVGEEPPPLEAPSSVRRKEPPERGKPKPKAGSTKKKAGERFKVLNTFVDFALVGLSRADIAVWLVLYRDTKDDTARTSYDDIARRSGCNRRTVGRALRRLEKCGLLKIVRRGGLRQGPSSYRVYPSPARH
jgi:predicted transcriptional regulator